MKSLLKKIVLLKSKLTRISDDEPVAALALSAIILLDIFILFAIFGGLEDHTRQLTSPDEYVPYQCREAFIEKDWIQSGKMAKLQQLVLTDYNRYSYKHDSPFKASRIRKMHPLCTQLHEQARMIADNDALKDLFVTRQQTVKKKDQLVRQYDRENEVYDTKLLEKIADESDSELSTMAASLKKKAAEIDRLNARITNLDAGINGNPLVEVFWALTRPEDGSHRERLIADLNRFERIYLLREIMWQMLFLLPLLAVFYVWHAVSVKRARRIQVLLSAHLIVIASIPIVIKIGEVVLELIPYHFFKELFDLLEQLHIIALWHYFVIIASVGVAAFCIFIIQKRLFSKARLNEKRLSKGACHSCGITLPGKTPAACPFCGEKQLQKCTECGGDTYIAGMFCIHCGRQQSAPRS